MIENFSHSWRRVAVLGASGAIGGALTDLLAATDGIEVVYAGSRRDTFWQQSNVIGFQFDLLSEQTIEHGFSDVGRAGPLDLVIVATGVLHEGALIKPEKTWRDFSGQAFHRAFAVNAIGPGLVMKYALPLLRPHSGSIFAALSARVGSIADNRSGGWAAYRASKAALNQIVKTNAIELTRRNKDAACVAVHPGTVDSALSKPFQRRLNTDAIFSPRESAEHLLRTLSRLGADQTGKLLSWDGTIIPF